jgi:hypothetical protein
MGIIWFNTGSYFQFSFLKPLIFGVSLLFIMMFKYFVNNFPWRFIALIMFGPLFSKTDYAGAVMNASETFALVEFLSLSDFHYLVCKM